MQVRFRLGFEFILCIPDILREHKTSWREHIVCILYTLAAPAGENTSCVYCVHWRHLLERTHRVYTVYTGGTCRREHIVCILCTPTAPAGENISCVYSTVYTDGTCWKEHIKFILHSLAASAEENTSCLFCINWRGTCWTVVNRMPSSVYNYISCNLYPRNTRPK